MKFSIVIPTYNRAGLLEKCLSSILHQDYPKNKYEVIIINDGSIDSTEKIIKNFIKKHKNIKYFKQKNKGHAVARNLGFSKAKYKIIVSTDDDCSVDKYWLKRIEETFKIFPHAGAVGGSIVNNINTNLANASHLLNFAKWDNHSGIFEVNDIPTANIAYRKEAIKDISFRLDEKKFGYRDALFNYRLIKKGKKIIFNPKIKVYHNKKFFNINDFLKVQRRHGFGFLEEGYKVHGTLGKTLIRFKILNLFCPRLLAVFMDSLRSKRSLRNFILLFPILVRGEFERSKSIYFS